MNIICPKCNCCFSESAKSPNPSCPCISILANDLSFYVLYYNNFKLFSGDLILLNKDSKSTGLVNYKNISNNQFIKYINCHIPPIIENNILQIDKMIDKFNKLYTLS